MISCPTVAKNVIQRHYDVSTLFYRLLWGPHIHHGLWHGSEPASEAQLQLINTLATLAGVARGSDVLDVGCGMGGSSIHLARKYDCRVTGVTISKLQRQWATVSAAFQRVGTKVNFQRADAEDYATPSGSLDIVWSVECTEHLFDKAEFFQKAASWLRPGGRMAICAWLAGETTGDHEKEQQVTDVCEGFFCPSLGTLKDYIHWFEEAGLEVKVAEDWTANVTQTWEICKKRVARTGVRWIAPWIDRDAVLFLDRFDCILDAYRSGAMQYGCLVAKKK